ncbi:hypothetical protein DRO69_12385 [Candidatus Bathyarchaeota archaeon]|nr:MAG: hypothetical protein DRO69_12385 [Candidatus Bathyarchaeota archaeon]
MAQLELRTYSLREARENTQRLRDMLKKKRGKQLSPMDLFYMRAYFGDVCEARGVYVALIKMAEARAARESGLIKEWKEIAKLHSEACELTAKILGV